MPFKNRIRLPIITETAQFPTQADRFRLADGTTKTLSVTIRKTYNVKTDYMGELMHQKLVIALNHDTVTIEGDKYMGDVAVDGEYQIDWPQFLDYPLGQANVTIQVTPFDATNTNCQSCDVLGQLELQDDDIGMMEQGGTGTVNVYTNDNVCCFPVTASITYFNTGYLDSATIDEATGIVTLQVKNPASPVGSIILATYRVTCPDGSYDEANVYGSITGSGEACEQPSSFDPVSISVPPGPFTIGIEWAAPVADPLGGYEWVLYDMANPGIVVDSGTSADKTVTFVAPSPNTNYGFYVRSVCADGIFSAYTELLFTTPEGEGTDCGDFNVLANDGTAGNTFYNYSYMDCAGIIRNITIQNLGAQRKCMLMEPDHTPVYFEGDNPIHYEYQDLC